MTAPLDLFDIQGDIVRPYGRFGFPFARYVFFNIRDGRRGRAFLSAVTARVTTAATWNAGPDPIPKPLATTNVALTYQGLKSLELPQASLSGFPEEFVMGMKARKDILGDDGPSSPEYWDPIWRASRVKDRNLDVHVLVSLNAQTMEALEERYRWLQETAAASDGGAVQLTGHRGEDGEDLPYQEGHALVENGQPCSKEHFGYTDGIGDPYFEGLADAPERVRGRGKQLDGGKWAPLATGEFLLGHIDEAHEYPPAPNPFLLSRNGTFMVYRKLHENVASFESFLERESRGFAGSKEMLKAKFVGRWADNGAPLVAAPDDKSKADWDARFARAGDAERDRMLSDFTYDEDMSGAKCPFSSHIRRINPRASLEFKQGDNPAAQVVSKDAFDTPGALTNRRRIIRRGLPYGAVKDRSSDRGNHGIVIMMLNADIGRQFEFVQQQWINYGNDFKASNDKEILLGNHDKEYPSRAVLAADPDGERPPYFLRNIPRLVETRGGDYFFIPSMTALRLIANGLIDPT
ncbi:MAG TPA: peroxidase [Burkholderiaceae bacterium]